MDHKFHIHLVSDSTGETLHAMTNAALAQFDDVEGFKAYADHPEHVRIITELIGPFIESRSPVQFTA